MAGRPKGIPNRPGLKKPGPKPSYIQGKFTSEQILKLKQELLELLESETCLNISEAAKLLGVMPSRVYGWFKYDPEWKALIEATNDVKADSLEKKLTDSKNVISWMFLLKKLRPEYRENYHIDVTTDPMRKLLEELKSVDKPKQEVTKPPEPTVEIIPLPQLPLPLPTEEVPV